MNQRVVEIRVHGVSGTPPTDILQDPHPKPVRGDDAALFLRRMLPVGEQAGHPQRTVEAFRWGHMTAGSASKALWLVLAPFGLINLARYTLPMSVRDGVEDGSRARRLADAILRLLGLSATLLLLATVAFVAIDLIGWQCAGTAVCAGGTGWLPFADDGSTPYGLRLLVASSAPAALIVLLWQFGRQAYLYPPNPGPAGPAGLGKKPERWCNDVGSIQDTQFWHTSVRAPILRLLHTIAATATLAVLVGWSTVQAPLGGPPLPSWARLALILLSVVTGAIVLTAGALVFGGWVPRRLEVDPTGRDPVKLPSRLVYLRWITTALAIATTATAAASTWRRVTNRTDNLPGLEEVFHGLYLAIAVLLVGLVGATAVLRWTTRSQHETGVPDRYRPLWRGFGAPVIACVAVLLATGFTSGTTIQIARLLGKPTAPGTDCQPPACGHANVVIPVVHRATTTIWGGLVVVALLIVLLVALWALVRTVRRDDSRLNEAICAQYEDQAAERTARPATGERTIDTRTLRKIASAWRTASLKFLAPSVVFGLAVAGAVVALVQAVLAVDVLIQPLRLPTGWLPQRVRTSINDVGAWAVTGVILLLLLLGFRAFRSEQWRRGVGVIWDLLAFWPRLAHPIVPPPYGGRAVLALSHRVTEQLQRDVDPADVVVLSGHSQGSLVCAATVCYLSGQSDGHLTDRLRLLTYGSQLQWVYPRLFPSYVGYHTLKGINEALHRRWFNLHRWTDPLGSVVLAYPQSPATRGFTGDKPPSALAPWSTLAGEKVNEINGPAGAKRIGAQEIQLLDPMWIDPPPDTPTQPILAHSGYYIDPAYESVLQDLVNLTPAGPPSPEPAPAEPRAPSDAEATRADASRVNALTHQPRVENR